jgi:hypothetical protein
MAAAKASASEWAARVRAWRASGESADEFAPRHGWNARTLTWWASRLRRSRSASASPTPSPVGFVRLVARRDEEGRERRAGAIEVVLERGPTVRVEPGADLDLLRAVVDALEVR